MLWSFVFPRGAPSRLGMHQLWADTVHPSVFFCLGVKKMGLILEAYIVSLGDGDICIFIARKQ